MSRNRRKLTYFASRRAALLYLSHVEDGDLEKAADLMLGRGEMHIGEPPISGRRVVLCENGRDAVEDDG